jgi:microcystin-dependent protein
MIVQNVSSRNILLRDSGNATYTIPAYGQLTIDDSKWSDNEFRRWVRFRIRDIIVIASVTGNPGDITLRGTLANRPAAGSPGRIYYITDAGQERWQRDSGTVWEELPMLNQRGTVTFGTQTPPDVNLYRHAVDVLATDDDLHVRRAQGGHITLGGATTPTITFGTAGDTNLYRSAADTLRTDDNMVVALALTVGGNLTNTSTTGAYLARSLSAATTQALGFRPSASTQDQLQITASGEIRWGSGAAAWDTNLYRSAADRLKTDDRLIVAQGIEFGDGSVMTSAVAPDAMPTGVVWGYAGATPPSGWLICDGSAISRTTFANLFNVIGTKYGVGNGSTTFNIPDYRGRTLVGLDAGQTDFNDRGKTGGSRTATLVTGNIPAHSHTVNSHSHTVDSHSHTVTSHTHTIAAHSHTVNSHSHGGNTGNQSADHTHTVASHNHGGATGGQSVDHAHLVNSHNHGGGNHSHSGWTSVDGWHAHTYGAAGPSGGAVVAFGWDFQLWSGFGWSTEGAGSHGHGVGIGDSGTIIGSEAPWTGGVSTDHSHSIPAQSPATGGVSANHTHTITAEAPGTSTTALTTDGAAPTTSSVAPATNSVAPGTSSVGSGTAFSIDTPYQVAHHIIKT